MLLGAAVVVGSSRRNPKTRKQVVDLCAACSLGNTTAVVVINLLDLYTVESAAPHGRWCNTHVW